MAKQLVDFLVEMHRELRSMANTFVDLAESKTQQTPKSQN